ncbi:MAG TPA: hypothetical protein VFM18_22665 [Methanosarcina sp.]|nr:hypothetical protein [Methanosarcina sp.]
MKDRQVTERDFRMPEFMDADPEDYEFRGDGKIVRKDRWERGIRTIANIIGVYKDLEIDNVVQRVRELQDFYDRHNTDEEVHEE